MIVHVSKSRGEEDNPPRPAARLEDLRRDCPQYLVLTAKDMEGLNMEGAK